MSGGRHCSPTHSSLSKSITTPNQYCRNKGRAVHLLKAGSKPVTHERKRRKIEIMSTPVQFSQMPEEQKQEESADAFMRPTYGSNNFMPPKMPTRQKK